MPLHIIFKGKNLWSSWIRGGPDGASYDNTESGWMESQSYLSWFKRFIEFTEASPDSEKKLLFIDGHVSHVSYQLINLAYENNIILFRLPAHTTHLLQPLDVSVFRPVKDKWRQVLKVFLKSNNFNEISKSDFTKLMKTVVEQSFTRGSAVDGFEKTGIYPLNRNKIKADVFKIGNLFFQHS